MPLMQLGPGDIRVDRSTINNVNLSITTRCDRACPWCAYGIARIPRSKQQDFSLKYLEAAGYALYGIDRVNVTGGEPTIHALFNEVAVSIQKWFGCRMLTIETNGAGAVHNIASLRERFDRVGVTHYTRETFPGSSDNSDAVTFLEEQARSMPDEWLSVWRNAKHEQFEDRRGSWPCARKVETVSFWDGLLYPCCASPGSTTRTGIIPTKTWRDDILDVSLPCEGCLFGEAKEG